MAAHIKDLVEPGTKWSGSDNVSFIVTEVTTNDEGTWVHYYKTSDNSTYNCLVDAFLQRFREMPNE